MDSKADFEGEQPIERRSRHAVTYIRQSSPERLSLGQEEPNNPKPTEEE